MIDMYPEVRSRPQGSGHRCATNPGEASHRDIAQKPPKRITRAGRRQDPRRLRSAWGSLARLLLGLALALGCAGCDAQAQRELLVEVGVVEEAAPQAVTVDLACDRSVGATCDAETVGPVVEREAARLATIPASTLRLWILDGPEPNVPAATVVAPTARRGNTRTARRQAEAWTREVRAAFVGRIAEDPPDDASTTSPLAELLTRIAAAGGVGERRIVVITDARQRSGAADMECRTPRESTWLASLRRHGLLGEGSMRNIHVVFLHVAPRPLEGRRCRSTVSNEAARHALWTAALRTAGAAHFELVPGAEEPPLNPPTESPQPQGASR